MRLKLDRFSEILVLTVEQAVSPRGVEVLNAGYAKLSQLKMGWLFVDLTGAVVPPESASLALATRPLPTATGAAGPGIRRIYFIGTVPGLCEFGSLEAALSACPSPEAALLKEKRELEREIGELRARKLELEGESVQSSPATPHRYALLAENRQLKRLKSAMLGELEEALKASRRSPAANRAGSSGPEDSELEEARAAALEALREAGVGGKGPA